MLSVVVISALVAALNVELASSNSILPLHGRIVGGEKTTIDFHPYQVSLQKLGRHICGGSIISENYVVTAAHCLYRQNKINLSIRAGTSFHNSKGSVHSVESFKIHEKYDSYETLNDVAVIKVNPPFKLDETRRPIKLFENNEPAKAGMATVVTGWGCIVPGCFSLPKQLQKVSIPIVSKTACDDAYDRKIPDGQICAGFLGVGGKDSCQGDSGGPLAIDGKLAGIVSWGRGCAMPDYPGVYTEISYYRDWIKNKTSV